MNQPKNRKVVVYVALTMVMVLLGAVAVITALRLQQLATEPVAPNVPQSQPQAAGETNACVTDFTVATSACKGWCDGDNDCGDGFECFKTPDTAETGVCVAVTDECEPGEQDSTCECPQIGVVSCRDKLVYKDVSANTAGNYDLAESNKLAANAEIGLNQQLVYAITLTSTEATGSATIEDTLPTTVTFKDAVTGCTHANGKVTCSYEGIMPKTFAYRVQVKNNLVATVEIKNTATVKDIEGEEDVCEATVRYVVGPTNTPTPTPTPTNTPTPTTTPRPSATPTTPANSPTPTTPQTHLACVNESCQEVSGGGSDQCNDDMDCARETHLACVGQACQEVDGGGMDMCSDDSDCLVPTPIPTTVPPDLPAAGAMTPTIAIIALGGVMLLAGLVGLLVW